MGLSAKQLDSLHGLSDTEQVQYESGAVRSADAEDVRYDLISPFGLERLARTYAEGAAKYSDHNWRKGMPASSVLNHALRHLNLYLRGDRTEDHLAHAAWNLFAVMEYEATRPAMLDLFEFPQTEPQQPVDLAESDDECQCEQCEPERHPGAVHVKSPEFMKCITCGGMFNRGTRGFWRVMLSGCCCAECDPHCGSTRSENASRHSKASVEEITAFGRTWHAEELEAAFSDAHLAELNQERSDRAQS